jgi:hypothetical protein
MATPIDPSIKTYVDGIIALCDQKILANQPNPLDPAQIAANKLEEIAAWNAYRNQALGFYAL